MADSYEVTPDTLTNTLGGSSLTPDQVNAIVSLVTGDDGKAVIQAVDTLDTATLNAAGANNVEVLQVSGGGNFNFDTLPPSVKVLVFTEPVVINGQTFSGTVLLGPGNDETNFSFVQVASTTDVGVVVNPGGGHNTVVGSAGVDTVTVGTGAHNTVNGATGVDTVKVVGGKNGFTITVSGNQVVVQSADGNTAAQVTNSEILQFDDGVVVVAGNQDEAALARLYEFMFGRTPDAEGMRWWIEQVRGGAINLIDAAGGFLNSQEASTNQINPSTDPTAFVNGLYQQGFHRQADAEGLQFWVDQLNSGMSQAEVIARFAASDEAGVTITGVLTVNGTI